MRLSMMLRGCFGIALVGTLLVLAQSEALSQNKLPPRPPIFLNNNASLYTFPNPNAGKPSQLAFAFVAVAHEDCRLYNNGAKLMPKHRLIAAECITGANGNNPMPLPPGTCQVGWCWDPGRFGRPVYQINCPRPPGAVSTAVCIDIRTTPPVAGNGTGTVNGINFARPGLPNPTAFNYGLGGNYESYTPGASQSSSMSTGSSGTSQSGFRGFSLPNDDHLIEFLVSVGTDPFTRFGSGFGLKCWACNMANPEPGPDPSASEGNE